jgi:hypothetical protein
VQTAVRTLFHLEHDLETAHVLFFFAFYTVMMCITSGTSLCVFVGIMARRHTPDVVAGTLQAPPSLAGC